MLIILNIAGTLFGFWYYRLQLPSTPLHKMIFVPDCPLYTLLFAIVLILHIFRKNNNLLSTITFIGLIKYGFWTLLVVMLHRDYYFTYAPMLYTAIFILHTGMVLEAYIIPGLYRFTKKSLVIALIWFIANDIMDYFFGTIPILPDNSFFSFLAIESFLMTIILVTYSKKYAK
ncbi:MAG: DUF1405 domain-containing protein [archaeon]